MAIDDEISLISAILENVPTPIFMSTPDGKIFYTNRELFGFTIYDLKGKSVYDLVRDELRDEYRRIITEVVQSLEIREFIFKEGADKRIQLRVSPVVVDNEVTSLMFFYNTIAIEGVHAEGILKEEQNRVEMYLQMASVIFLVLNAHGEIVLINRKGTEVLGYSKDELLGTSWFDYIPISTRDQVVTNFRKLIDGRIDAIEYIERELLTKTGDERLIAWQSAVLQDAEGNSLGVISSGEDITEKRVTQQELKQSQEMFKLVMNNIPQYVFWKDTESRYLGCNPVFAINAGFGSPDELIGKHDLEMPWRVSESEVFLEADRLILSGSIKRYDNIEHMRKADGTDALFRTIKVPLTDLDNNIIGVLGTAEDVTEKRKAELELARSEQKFRTLLQSLDDLVFVFDEEGRYVDYFAKSEDFLYVRPSEFLRKPITEVLPLDVSIPFLESMKRVRTTGVSETFDYCLPDESGERWFSSNISPHEDGKNVVTVIREITSRVKAARDLELAFNIINLSTTVAFLWRNEPNRPVEFVTGNVHDLFGYSLEELKSGHISYKNLIHPDDWERVRNEVRGFSADRLCDSYTHEPYRIVAKSGEVRWISDFTVLRRDEQGNITHRQSVLSDVTSRILIEQALRESESRYRSVIEQSLMGIAVISEQKTIIFANSMLSHLLNRSVDELTSMDLSGVIKLIHPEDLESTDRFIAQCFEGHEEAPIVIRIIYDESTTSWFEIFGSRILYENKDAVQLSVIDISERYLAVEALRRERASFRSIAESAILANETEEMARQILHGFMQAMNLEIGSIDLVDFKKCTLRPTAWFGVPASVAMSDIPLDSEITDSYIVGRVCKTKERIISPDITLDLDLEQYPYVHQLGFRSLLVMPLIGTDGNIIGTFSSGSRKPGMVNARDSVFYETISGLLVTVLERKQTEQAYRMSIRRYRDLLTDLPEGIAIVDLDENFVFVNEAFCRILGYETEELLGTDSRIMIHPDDIDFIIKETASRIHGRSSAYQVRMIRKDGEERIVRISAIPSRDNAGEVEGTIAVITDITERVRAENEVRKLNEELAKRVKERTAELEAANKELESFAYTVSHDLRAPLRIIDGFSQAILEDYGNSLDDAGNDYLNRIRKGVANMAGLIEDTLGLSRVTRAEMERVEVNLSKLAEEVVAELKEGNSERSLQISIESDVVTQCDKRFMRVVLQNLIENSWKFTSKVSDPQIHFGRYRVDNEEVYYVRDNGVGFNMAYAEKLFKPFQRLHGLDEFEGSGIGLATVMRIVTRHGGRIWAEAEPGKGATFCFTLK
ncbi:MAG: PAS domain S-box protein [Candidatus Thorarchaeota archaeon]|nr:PAS domain S-box protein [Candidatus Thorarchaeota archaeon]